jgi:membrane associated rhomboid family serine protease
MQFPTPRATITLAAATSAAWLITTTLGLDLQAAYLAGFIPARVGTLAAVPGAVPVALTPLTATLVHGGIIHLGFNMLMLVFCGRMVEAALGRWGIVLLYLLGAYAAAAAQFAVDPASAVPMIGASGAISALVGAYALLFGQRRATAIGPISGEIVHVLWLAAAWIGLQLLLNFAATGEGAMIATAAHVGGFVLGLLLARPILRFRYRNA